MRALLQRRPVQGLSAPGRHTLQSQNIPFLNGLITSFTGGNVFIAEVFFVKMQPIRGVTFGGPLESMEDPILFEFVTPRIFGEFAMVVTDPVRFVIGYFGQAAGSMDNDQTLKWIKDKFFMSVKTVIGQVCVQQQKSLLNLGGMTGDIAAAIIARAPSLEEIGVKITDVNLGNISFNAEDQQLLRDANKERGAARRGVGIASDTARAEQFKLDQKFQQDARYVQQLAGNWNNYAAGSAMMGAGEGMAKGGGNAGVAGLGAQMAVGMGMGNMMAGAQPQGQPPQFVPPYQQHGGPPSGQNPSAPTAAGGKVSCPKCSAAVPMGKFCAECGTPRRWPRRRSSAPAAAARRAPRSSARTAARRPRPLSTLPTAPPPSSVDAAPDIDGGRDLTARRSRGSPRHPRFDCF